jgi:hypothetical protein
MTPIERDVSLVSVLPLIETPIDSLVVEAVLPGGGITRVIALRSPDPAWPRTYRFSEPLALPRGTIVRVSSEPSTALMVVLGMH